MWEEVRVATQRYSLYQLIVFLDVGSQSGYVDGIMRNNQGPNGQCFRL